MKTLHNWSFIRKMFSSFYFQTVPLQALSNVQCLHHEDSWGRKGPDRTAVPVSIRLLILWVCLVAYFCVEEVECVCCTDASIP